MKDIYYPGDYVHGDWKLTELIGEGSYGRVYRAERSVQIGTKTQTSLAAIKIISIPKDDGEVKNALKQGRTQEQLSTYYQDIVHNVINEVNMMSELKGNTNIVSYEHFTVEPDESRIKWEVIIRMELLTPLLDYVADHPVTRRDVVSIGIDICKALEICKKSDIIHRDIKLENIFVSKNVDYKLGDFGVARVSDKTVKGTMIGTPAYMAPEMLREESYNATVDTYSLGLVLYRLLNNGLAPFETDRFTPDEQHRAQTRRKNGEKFPDPINSGGKLTEVVLKACEPDPKDRYSDAAQMRHELEELSAVEDDEITIFPSSACKIMPLQSSGTLAVNPEERERRLLEERQRRLALELEQEQEKQRQLEMEKENQRLKALEDEEEQKKLALLAETQEKKRKQLKVLKIAIPGFVALLALVFGFTFLIGEGAPPEPETEPESLIPAASFIEPEPEPIDLREFDELGRVLLEPIMDNDDNIISWLNYSYHG